MLGERVACATVSPHLCILSHRFRCYRSVWQLLSDLGYFGDGVCHVMKIIMVESNPDIHSK